MELEYNEELDAYIIIIPDKLINQLDWNDGTLLEYEIEDEILRIYEL